MTGVQTCALPISPACEVLVRLWREIISAFLRMQGAFSVAVVSDGPDLLPLVREEYGSSTPIASFRTAGQALGALREGNASLAVLPLPREVEERPWWPMLFGNDEARPFIAARLPFAMPGLITRTAICATRKVCQHPHSGRMIGPASRQTS